MPRRRLKARASLVASRGFTLVEILVVVVIIGVIVSAATLGVGVLGGDREIEHQSRRFWAVLQQAREEAELQGMDIGVFVARSEFEYLRFNQRLNRWEPMLDDPLYAPRELAEGVRFRLWLEGREIVLKPALPERGGPDEDEKDEKKNQRRQQTLDENNKKFPPQIMVLSSGDVMPFELRIERDGMEALWRVVGLADNDLRVERRATDRGAGRYEWLLVAQTAAPPEDEQDRKSRRISSAR